MVGDGASTHKIDYVNKFYKILNLEGHQNCITGSKGIAEAASGRVCACSLRSRLVFTQLYFKSVFFLLIKKVNKSNNR